MAVIVSAVTVVLASEGYPEQPITGRAVTGVDAAERVPGVHVAHAATAVEVNSASRPRLRAARFLF